MSEAHKKDCLHCAMIALIEARYPHGVDRHAASAILGALAATAGDILANADEQPLQAFVDVVVKEANIGRGMVKFICEGVH